MIHFLVVSQNLEPLNTYQRTWGKSIADRMSLITYDELPGIRELRPGTYIFCDVDLITAEQRRVAEDIWTRLASMERGFHILNHPRRSLQRYELLQLLHRDGINSFNAYHYTSPGSAWRYPVFLRDSADHAGSRTEMIQDRKELDRGVVRLVLKGVPIRNLLVVEFCDISDGDGIYRKYSAFRIGDQIVPRHLVFSRKWVLKAPDLADPEKLEEERKYLEGNPHAEELRRIFDLACIEYGRMDYGLRNGKIQVWEINTNPYVLLAPERYQAEHMPHQE